MANQLDTTASNISNLYLAYRSREVAEISNELFWVLDRNLVELVFNRIITQSLFNDALRGMAK